LNFKKSGLMKRQFVIVVAILLSITMCENWGWQDVESDQESMLNIFALVSLDTTISSFVHVRQTLNLDDEEMILVDRDTLWYGDSPYDYVFEDSYRSNFLVDSAVVTISDGNKVVRFFPVRTEENYGYIGINEFVFQKKMSVVYLDTLHQFNPVPGTIYFLEVTAPDGRRVTGSLVTPAIPVLLDESIPDTLHLQKSYTIPFEPLPDNYQILRTITNNYTGENKVFIEPGSASWKSFPEDASSFDDDDFDCDMEIRLTAMDDNYYEYFVKKPLDDEFVSFLLGDANSGLSCGIEGGYGLFGAIAVDHVYRIAVR